MVFADAVGAGAIDTAELADNAVSDIDSDVGTTGWTGGGDTTWRTSVASVTVTIPSTEDILLLYTMDQVYSSGQKNWGVRVEDVGGATYPIALQSHRQ